MDARMTAGLGNGARPRWPRAEARLQALFDWLSGLPRAEAAELGSAILDTVMLRPVPLLLSAAGILLMSATAAIVTGSGWAMAWFAADLILLGLRLGHSWRLWRGRVMGDGEARVIVCIAFAVCLLFGAGCTASVLAGPPALRIAATAATMGLVAGLATRWAALPRLAMTAITLSAVPFCLALALSGAGGALQFGLVAAGTAMLTLQNQRTLLAMLRAEHRARRSAETDPLTGLPNRAGLEAHWARLAREARWTRDAVAVLYVDLDGFKAVNDRFGHAAGDRLLAEVAARLRVAAAGHFACRLGGDEFVVVAAGADDRAADQIAASIRERIGRPVTLDDATVRIGASVGIAAAGMAHALGSDGAQRLLTSADAALYRAKRGGADYLAGLVAVAA